MNSYTSIVFILFMLSCSYFDIRTNKIPNVLTIPFSFLALVSHSYTSGLTGFFVSLAGLAAGIGLLLVPYLLQGMGAGDVKLMGAVGSFLGVKATLEAFLLVAILGGIYSVTLIALRRETFRGLFKHAFTTSMITCSGVARVQDLASTSKNENSRRRPRLKYGVPIALGTITYLILNSFGIQSFI